MSAKARATGRYICPNAGRGSICEEHAAPFPHIREEWVLKGQRVPRCETCDVRLVPA